MFKIDNDLTMHVTRGDACTFSLTADANGGEYTFRAGDLLRFKVFERKACHCVVLQKDTPITEDTTAPSISLSGEDTKLGEIIHKPKDYWYEVEMNPEAQPVTLIGYDENGGKVFRLYPEGGEPA
jgi:hypothetical protein